MRQRIFFVPRYNRLCFYMKTSLPSHSGCWICRDNRVSNSFFCLWNRILSKETVRAIIVETISFWGVLATQNGIFSNSIFETGCTSLELTKSLKENTFASFFIASSTTTSCLSTCNAKHDKLSFGPSPWLILHDRRFFVGMSYVVTNLSVIISTTNNTVPSQYTDTGFINESKSKTFPFKFFGSPKSERLIFLDSLTYLLVHACRKKIARTICQIFLFIL